MNKELFSTGFILCIIPLVLFTLGLNSPEEIFMENIHNITESPSAREIQGKILNIYDVVSLILLLIGVVCLILSFFV